MIHQVSVTEASKAAGDSKNILIDVRELDEVAALSTPLARVFPMSVLNPETFEQDSGISKDSSLYVLCRSGARSMRVAQALSEQGYKHLYNVEGGILAWSAASLPVTGSSPR